MPKTLVVDNETDERIIRKTFYRLWGELPREVGIDREDRISTYYSRRHFFTTSRLYQGVGVFLLSELMGCSVKFIRPTAKVVF